MQTDMPITDPHYDRILCKTIISWMIKAIRINAQAVGKRMYCENVFAA